MRYIGWSWIFEPGVVPNCMSAERTAMCSGTNRSLTTMSLLPVARSPCTYHVSSTVASDSGKAIQCMAGLPSTSQNAWPMHQSQCITPLPHFHCPFSL